MIDRASVPATAYDRLGVTDNRDGYLTLIVRPRIEERNGCRFHLDRFDAYLDGELILVSRQPWYDGARELLRRGYPSGALLTMRYAGKDYDCFVPLEIGYLAERSISESNCGGLKRIRWQPMPEHLKQRATEGTGMSASTISVRCSKLSRPPVPRNLSLGHPAFARCALSSARGGIGAGVGALTGLAARVGPETKTAMEEFLSEADLEAATRLLEQGLDGREQRRERL